MATKLTGDAVYQGMVALYVASDTAYAAFEVVCEQAREAWVTSPELRAAGLWWGQQEVIKSKERKEAAYAAVREYSQRYYNWG